MTASPNWSDVNTAQQQSQQAQQSAIQFGAGGNTLADELRKAVSERFDQSGIAQDAATARSNFLQAAPTARNDIANLISGGAILSPTQQDQIMASKRASALAPVIGANDLESAAFGTMNDLISAGTNAWNKQAQYQQGMAQLAQGNYQNLLDELLKKSQYDQNAQMFPLDMQLKQAQIGAANRSNTGTSTKTANQIKYEQALTTDAKQGITLKQALTKYAGYLEPDDIYQTYNASSKWGPATENQQQLSPYGIKQVAQPKASKYTEQDIADFANAVADGRSKITGVPAEIRGKVDALATQIQDQKRGPIGNFFQGIGDWFSNL